MPYLEAFIAETMRFSAITALGGIHSTTEPVEFHGYIIPKDTICFGNFWAMHNDREYWGDPEAFCPDRFIGSDGSFKKDERVIPFSIGTSKGNMEYRCFDIWCIYKTEIDSGFFVFVGKRACLGEGLARDELFLFLTSMLQQLEFKIDPNGPPPSLEPKQSTILHTRPYEVVMKLRPII